MPRHAQLADKSVDLVDAGTTGQWEGGESFSFSNCLYHALWAVACALLARWTPSPLRAWRLFLLNLFGAKLAPTANMYGSARTWPPRNLEFGDYAAIGWPAPQYLLDGVYSDRTLCNYPAGCASVCGTHDLEDPNFQFRPQQIAISAWAWVAAEAFVGPGVIVDKGSVLGAGTCAMRSLDARGIYSGNPAMRLRDRHVRFKARKA